MDHGRNHSSGKESHGVHLCRKCGWPFPNPHPSARHRRAHRKICGTIEGFKPAEEMTHTNASDDDPISDEDHKSPSSEVPKVVEISSVEESAGGIGAMSNRSEGFSSGAAMEFQDSGFGVRRQDSLDNVGKPDKDLDATISLKHFEDSDIQQPPRNSAERNQNEDAFLESMPIVSTGTLEHQDDGLSYGKDFEDKNASAIDVVPIKMETLKGFSGESREVGAGPSTAACSVEQPTNVNGNEQGKVNKNLSDDLILPGEISKTVSFLEKRLDVTLDIVQLKEDYSDMLASKTSMNETGKQEETNGNGNPGMGLERNVADIVSSNSKVPSGTTGKKDDISSAAALAHKFAESSVEFGECVSQDKSDSSLTNQLDEDVEIDASYMQVAKDNNEAIVIEVLLEEKAGVLQRHKWSNALYPLDADTTEDEKDQKTCTLREGQPVYVADDFDLTGFSGTMINDLLDVQSMVPDADTEAGKSNNMFASEWARGNNLTKNASCESVDTGKKKTEKGDMNVVESGDRPEDLIKANSTSEPISADNQFPDVIEEANSTSVDRVSKREDDIKKPGLSRDNKVRREGSGELLMSSAVDNSRGGNELERTSIDQSKKDLIHSTSCSEYTVQSSGAVNDSHAHESGPAATGISAVTLQGDTCIGSVKPQLDTTIGDVSIGSGSHTDSLEAHWGSISVVSTQSEAEKAKKSKVASDSEQHFDNSKEFDPPSFMTLVEAGGGDQKSTVSEMQAVQTAQSPQAMPLQAAWFLTLTQVANESPGRKKNEEIIKKVTNWNAKQHTPLKNLLSEASSETKLKSPSSKQSPGPVVIPCYDKVAEETEATPTVPKFSSETPVAEPTDMEAVKEWSSPARFPAEIKREKRKVKGRPLWVQFVCCSSIN